MKNFKNISIFLLLILLSCSDNKIPLMTKINDPKPASFSLNDQNGKLVDIKQFKDSYILVNFWATWCKPCVNEIPSLDNLNKKFNDNDSFHVVAINIGQNKNIVEKFLKKINDVSFLILFDEEMSLTEWNVQAIPTTYLINDKGIILYRAEGERHWDSPEFVSFINTVIQK